MAEGDSKLASSQESDEAQVCWYEDVMFYTSAGLLKSE
jgi:hypothetical protein